MTTWTNRILKFIGLLVLIMIISLAPELLGGDLEAMLKEKLGDRYKLIIISISLLALLIYTFWSEGSKFFKKEKIVAEPEKILDAKIRKGLIKAYQDRLKSKLATRHPINLQIKYDLTGTSTKAPLYDNKTIKDTAIKKELIEIFETHRGRLLIIGEPGAGKTTLLLQLALTLFLHRESSKIPIIINIATWRTRFKSVAEWLQELLPQMGFSTSLVETLIKENKILPLFDGLDELVEENRKACLEAIGQYGATSSLQYVICSRIEEYAQTVDAPVYCQIKVRPLTLTQIKEQLKVAGTPEANGMLDAINKDHILREIIKTPFYLNTTQLLFSTMKSLTELNFQSTDTKQRKKELIKIFIKEQLAQVTYPFTQVKHWLSFFAYEMNQHNLVTFELLDLQYTWSKWSKRQITKAKIVGGLVFGLIYGLILSLVGGIIGSLAYNMIFDCFLGLIIGLGIGVLGGILENINRRKLLPIITKDKVHWSSKFILQKIKHAQKGGIAIGLVYGLITSLEFGLFVGLFWGIIGGISLGFIVGLLIGVIDILEENHYSFIQLNHPYQRFRASYKALHFSILQHKYLKYQLAKKGLLPKDLVTFLNELSQQHLLETDGATWRFRHRILQDHFAELWQNRGVEVIDKED